VPVALLGWELGAGYGHAAALLELAHALARRGVQPVLALRDLREPWPLLTSCPFPALQAPRLPSLGDASFVARSFLDVLAASGFAEPDGLAAVLRGWDGLIELVRPHVVVTNHAPALALAAYGVLPCVVTGTGFTVPPGDAPEFPALLSGAQDDLGSVVGAVVRDVAAARGRPAPQEITELYRTNSFALTVPELDPYRPVRVGPVAGPLTSLLPPVPGTPQQAFFAYLSADAPWAEPVLHSLSKSAQGAAYLRGADTSMRQRLADAGVQVWAHPPALADVLRSSAVVIHHGSHATALATLAAGRPQLCLPRHLEQSLTGHLLEELGAGRSLRGELPPDAPAEALPGLLAPQAAQAARELAETIAGRGYAGCVDLIADRCAELAAG
jgi:hypothetical protein